MATGSPSLINLKTEVCAAPSSSSLSRHRHSPNRPTRSPSLTGVQLSYLKTEVLASQFSPFFVLVTYQTELFLDKNKDYVVAEHQTLLNASKCPFVSGLFPPAPEESSKQSKFSLIGSRFKGVMEAIRISCAGYPTRKTFDEFVDRFDLFEPEAVDGRSSKEKKKLY